METLKTFFFKHVEKVLLGLAAAGLIYVVVHNLTRASVSLIVRDLQEKAGTVSSKLDNPEEPPSPGAPPPRPLEQDLVIPAAKPAPSNPFVFRVEAAPTSTTTAVAPVAPGVGPPKKVLAIPQPGVNVIEWWRAPGQSSDVRVQVFRLEKSKFPDPVPETIPRSRVAALGFQMLAKQVAAGGGGHGVYKDTNIVGEVPYVYALSSVRVTVEESTTSSGGSLAEYNAKLEELVAGGIDPIGAIAMLGPPPSETTKVIKTVTPREWGNVFRTTQVKTAIPLVFELKSVLKDKETGEPAGRVLVKRLVMGQWYSTYFTVGVDDEIGDLYEATIRPPGEKPYREEIDLRTGATVLGFEEFEEEVTIQMRERTITRAVKNWKMKYRDKDGNTREMVKSTGR